MPDYKFGKIYAIRAPGTNDVYYGSTTCSLAQRFAQHKYLYMRWIDGTTNRTTSFSLLEMEGVYIELVENYACETKEQLNRREGQIIRSDPNAINRCVAGRTSKEYKEDNAERVAQKSKEWWAKNKEQVKETRRLRKLNKYSPSVNKDVPVDTCR